ncbi:hypothetical protein [Catenuloplanes indicus]|uniref:Uncharacterized protein n=1 Tax=Catenuloplanes indicus TaxID=137267 RepID=A0AAE3W9S8_9ACTN|nr:hypothetical protein [Catenuloplanes indicus]MDQ0371092.1 hypothetical protein [Catenuloplanes indicus]
MSVLIRTSSGSSARSIASSTGEDGAQLATVRPAKVPGEPYAAHVAAASGPPGRPAAVSCRGTAPAADAARYIDTRAGSGRTTLTACA